MIRTVIVDDEADSREVIQTILTNYCPQVAVLGQAANAEEAFKLISAEHPDLVFLDIQMQPETGFDLLNRFDAYDFEVIFVTAWNQYAIEAIKHHALDYLLKPLDIDELLAAINKATTLLNRRDDNVRLKQMMTNINLIGITMSDGIEFALTEDIIRCEANGFYTWFFLINNRKILATKNLKKYEEQLASYHFFSRVHSSHLINIKYLKKYVKGESYLLMSDGTKVPVSRTFRSDFIATLSKLGIIP